MLKLLWENHDFSLRVAITGGKKVHVFFFFFFRKGTTSLVSITNRFRLFPFIYKKGVKLCRRKCLQLCVTLSESTEKTQVTILKIPALIAFSFESCLLRSCLIFSPNLRSHYLKYLVIFPILLSA